MKARKLSILKAVKIKGKLSRAQVKSASEAEPGAMDRYPCYSDAPETESNHVLYARDPKAERAGTPPPM